MTYPQAFIDIVTKAADDNGFVLDRAWQEGSQKDAWLIKISPKKTPELKPTMEGHLNFEYLLSNAKILISAAEYSPALSIFRAIVQSGKKNSEICSLMGRCYEALNQDDLAAECYEESIAFSSLLETYQKLASIWIKAKAFADAARVYDRALSSKLGSESKARVGLLKASGDCWALASQFVNAQTRYLEALDLDPKADHIRSNVGYLSLQHQLPDEAMSYFQDALAANPSNPKALLGLAYAALSKGDKNSAHDYLIKTLNAEIAQPEALFQLIHLSFELKSFVSASRILQDYIDVSPVSANLLYTLGGIQFLLGRLKECRQTLQKILQIQPDHAPSLELMGKIETSSENEPSWRTFKHGTIGNQATGIEPRK